jgi:hypothetical protein
MNNSFNVALITNELFFIHLLESYSNYTKILTHFHHYLPGTTDPSEGQETGAITPAPENTRKKI